MATKRKMLGQRNGLKIYSQLKSKSKLAAKTGLKAKKPINKVSKTQAVKNEHWTKITNDKCELLGYHCEWCGELGTRDKNDPNILDGHHTIPRRFNIHTPEVCYIAHRLSCHKIITDKNIDVGIYKNRQEWEAHKKCDPINMI